MVKSKMSLTYKFLTAINSYFVVPHAGLKNLVATCRLSAVCLINFLKSVSCVRIFSFGQAGVTDTLLHLYYFAYKLTASSCLRHRRSKPSLYSVCELVHNIVFESRRVARTYVGVFDWLISYPVCG